MSLIYTNAMLDLETMGNSPDAAIVAIGAVAFDLEAGELGSTWYNRISLESAVQAGGVIDASTVLWWLQQSEEARQEIARPGGMHINEALRRFAGWLAETTEPDVVMWGNGASFDNVILRSAYRRAGQPVPWAWWNDRCYRTVKAQYRHVPFERLGTHHNALSDATSQALHLIKMLSPRIPESGPLQKLGARLSSLLDEDQWAECERMLLEATRAQPGAEARHMAIRIAALEEAAQRIEQRAAAYDDEHGRTDPETGTREYPGNGDEYMYELEEIAEDLRSLKAKKAEEHTQERV